MKGSLDRTKVVLRHLPHNISQSVLMEQIDTRFSGRYNWSSFRSGKNSLKSQSYSRAYINFKQPEDVIEFAEFFDRHVFVNEKGTQYKTIVEYAPSQRVPKEWSKKDGREGTIDKDPQYLEFLELLAKPVENLPSAEIQLERREAERAGTAKESPIVTPLMDFVRQKRAAKGGPRRSLPNGKLVRRASGAPSSSSTSAALKRGSERRRTSTTMYVPRDNGKGRSSKEKPTYVQIHKRDDQQLSENSVGSSGSVVPEEGRGSSDIGKKKILLLKGKEKEIPHNQHREASGRMIKSILINKQNQSEQQKWDMDKRPPRPASSNIPTLLKDSNNLPDDDDLHGFYKAKQQDKRTRNKDRPDRGVWSPLVKRFDESPSSTNLQSTQDAAQGFAEAHGQVNYDVSISRGGGSKPSGSGRGGHFLIDNGSHRHGGRRGPSQNAKDIDSFSNSSDGKPSKRGVSTGYASHEKQVWVQKSSSGS